MNRGFKCHHQFGFPSLPLGIAAAVLLLLGGYGPAASAASEDQVDWAKEREFWSFRPPAAPSLPAVKNAHWPEQPLDFFVLARLEEKELEPAPETDRSTLIRRLTFDLTGLPPTPEAVQEFCADVTPDGYERLVDRLLASPRFGERLASLWLPLARYAEDQAFQVGSDTKMFYPNAHRYREWVIGAFNQDLPYDEFIRLQLAADKLGTNQLAALGFLGLGPKYYDRGRLAVMADEWEDRVDTVTRTFLGLTVSCSRCHDHKFDPITTADYYALAGVFASTRMVNRRPDGQREEDKTEAPKMDPHTLHVVEDGALTNLHVFVRGNVERKGPEVARRYLTILSQGTPAPFTDGSGRRELAEALSDPSNPLTARVLVNRVWGLVFGRPLVPTSSNFGRAGEKPSHPELLDFLATEFVQKNWSVKALVRQMVLSATYRQSSTASAATLTNDPANELFSRMIRRRLTVEQWRDAVLFVSGDLDYASGRSQELEDPANRRRTVQARISRLKLNDLLMQFDYPDANVHAEKRSASTTATQKLFLLNSPFIIAQAHAFARRITAVCAASPQEQIQRAYALLFGRNPTEMETELALEFLRRPESAGMTRWEQFAQVLLISNQMLYVD